MDKKNYYLGLDIGTDSVGYAACNTSYELLKFHGDAVWGSTIFDKASLSSERRGFRSARRRLDRRQERVLLLQAIFAKEIGAKDERFFIRLSESYRWRDETPDRYVFFNDKHYTDRDYFRRYPTIHHLISDLMSDSTPKDVRLVYLACAWLVAHRGHFLSNVDEEHIEEIRDIHAVYQRFAEFLSANDYICPWDEPDMDELAECLKRKTGVTAKYKGLVDCLLNGKKPEKETGEDFPFSADAVIRLLAGGQVKPVDLFKKEEYAEQASFSLGMDEEKHAELMSDLGDDYELIGMLRGLYDWSVLSDSLGDAATISEAKVMIYEQHKRDLALLKKMIRKYAPEKYKEVFREIRPDNYVAYSFHSEQKDISELKRKADQEIFSKYLKKICGSFEAVIEESDREAYTDLMNRLGTGSFLPKQKTTDNRVIPHQLYYYELRTILKNASHYLPFLTENEDGITNEDKILSIFKYKLPYFVGPLNTRSNFSWLKRNSGKITPWNYDKMIDMDESEQNFIRRMTNQCTYLPGEHVLPKDSLCYHKFMVLNELNNLKIHGQKISVDLKQELYQELFEKKKKVTRKQLVDYLLSNGYVQKGEEDTISGIDEEIKANLAPQFSFRKLLKEGMLSEQDVEKVIERAAYAEDKKRLAIWLEKNYGSLSEEDRKYICSIRIKDFGRLSRRFLTEFSVPDKETGEAITILGTMWDTNDNLMEILSDKYLFRAELEAFTKSYYAEKEFSLNERLDNMYISNAVKRPIYRTLAIVDDVRKAFGEPSRIFIEMARGGKESDKGKRTKSRHQQILELYAKCKEEDVRDLKHALESMGEYVDNRLQGDRLFLYFMQFGKSAYSGKAIELEKLMSGSKEYDVDHIYPQAYVKDDSIINNKVLVLSTENGEKKDRYPIQAEIRHKMHGIWSYWHQIGTVSDEKYRRLTRATAFTDDEKYGFINRQLTETSQSTKAVAQLLKEQYPNTEIVYVKARLTSEFRQEFDLYKSRSFNDLHHAVDAYLNIVTGNVYDARFSKRFFDIHQPYSIKTKTLFTHVVKRGEEVVWDPDIMLERVKKTATKNTAHFTKYAFFKTGGLFDQMPVKKAPGLVPLKKGLPTERYGGYNKAGAMFYIPVRYRMGKKNEIIVMSVELLYGKRFLQDQEFAKEYAFSRLQHILGKPVDEVSFPMGRRPWKVNTMLSLDGFRVCITSLGSRGAKVNIQPIVQFSTENHWKYYLKKLEALTGKMSDSARYIYDEEHDKVSADENLRLYDLYLDKLTNSIYRKRVNNPKDILVNGRTLFQTLSMKDQIETLLNIQQVFGRMTGGCNLTKIGGALGSAEASLSSKMSNWKKYYKDVRIVDASPSGIWEQKSENLLDLL